MSNIQLIYSKPMPAAFVMAQALKAALPVLLRNEAENVYEIRLLHEALEALGPVEKVEARDILLGKLYRLGYGVEDYLFRITTEDFADVLLEVLTGRGLAPETLDDDNLDNLIAEIADYFNSTFEWRSAIQKKIENVWPQEG